MLPDNKFLKTGSTPLQQNGSNSIKISKANLPAEKLQVESFNLTRGTMDITGSFNAGNFHDYINAQGAFTSTKNNSYETANGVNGAVINFTASRSWTGSTSSASPYTTTMGSGIPISINPEHITIKAWKRTK